MNELSLNPSYVRMLTLKVRALMSKEEVVTPDVADNAADDEIPQALQELDDDLSREEIIAEIDGLSPREQAELVALMWIGRGDAEPEEWQDTLRLAHERREVPTSRYLLDHPLLADEWSDALDKLGYGSMVEGGRRL